MTRHPSTQEISLRSTKFQIQEYWCYRKKVYIHYSFRKGNGSLRNQVETKGKSNKSQGQTESGSPVFFSVNSAPDSPLSITPHPPPPSAHTHTHTQLWTTQPPPTLPLQLASHFFISLFLILSSSSNHACESPPLVKSDPEHLLSLPLSLCCTECPGPAHHLLQGSQQPPNWPPYVDSLHFNLLS